MPPVGFFLFVTEEGYYYKTSDVNDITRNNCATTKASRISLKSSIDKSSIQRFNVAVKDMFW